MRKALFALCVIGVAARAEKQPAGFLQEGEKNAERNPLSRSADKQGSGEKGEEAAEGDTKFLLVTSFDEEIEGSGKVWVVPTNAKDRKHSFVLIGGLQTPTCVCFDKNHDFVYVCDPGQRAILQFETVSGGNKRLKLASNQVATIALQVASEGCAIDAYGNLYFSDSASDTIQTVSYEDLWPGFVGMSRTLYAQSKQGASVARPTGIAVFRSEVIYFTNSRAPEDNGVLNSAPVHPSSTQEIRALLRSEQVPRGLALSNNLAYFSAEDGTLWAYAFRKEQATLYLKSAEFFDGPRGICYGDGDIYIADFSQGAVFTMPDSPSELVSPHPFIRLPGAYGLSCINL